jgi:CopG family nickel-responsive transcriptional regulator
MSELVRFGVAIDGDLLAKFDERLAARGYSNRSEAIRDLIRDDLVEAVADAGGVVAGSLTLVYDHHARDLSEKLTEMQHALGEQVVSTLHVHLDHDHCLEVVVMRGPAAALKGAAERILATKGVVHGKLTLTGIPEAIGAHHHPHAEGDAHAHAHPHAHAHGDEHGHGHEKPKATRVKASVSSAFAKKARAKRG